MPFSVWVDALDAYVASQRVELHEAWDDELAGELAQVLPRSRARARGVAIADERYKAHRAVRTLLGVIADEQPLVLLLDDLHWSDAASVEMIAALLRREPSAPVLMVLAYRPRQLPERLAAAVAGQGVERLRLEELSEAEAGAAAGGGRGRRRSQRSIATGAATRSTSSSSAAPRTGSSRSSRRSTATGPGGAAGGGCGHRVGARFASAAQSRALLDAAAVAGEPFEPDLAAAEPAAEADGLDALDDLLAARPRAPDRGAAALRVPPSARSPGRLRVDPRRLEAGGARTRGGRRSPPTAPAPPSAPTTSSSRPARATRRRSSCCSRPAATAASRAPAASVRWFEAALRLLPASDSERPGRGARRAGSRTARGRGAGPLPRRPCSTRRRCCPPDAVARQRRADRAVRGGRALAGPPRGRAPPARCALGPSWPTATTRRGGRAADRAGRRRHVRDGLRADGRRWARTRWRPRARARRPAPHRGRRARSPSARRPPATSRRRRSIATRRSTQVERMSDAELARRLETLYYLGWAENYLERYDDGDRARRAGMEMARATGAGPAARPADADARATRSRCRAARRGDRDAARRRSRSPACPATRTTSFWALFELGWAHYYAGDVDGAIEAGEESQGRRAPSRRHDARQRRRPGLGAGGRAVRAGRSSAPAS